MQTVSDFILSRLAQWGIQRVYGYPGDGINGLIGAFGRTSEPLEFVQARHLIDRAVRIALERRTVTCVIVPNDVQDLPAVSNPPREHGTVHTGIGFTSRAGGRLLKLYRMRPTFSTRVSACHAQTHAPRHVPDHAPDRKPYPPDSIPDPMPAWIRSRRRVSTAGGMTHSRWPGGALSESFEAIRQADAGLRCAAAQHLRGQTC